MQGPASRPHTPPENTETTHNPCWAPFKDQESPSIKKLGQRSPQPPLHLHAYFTAPAPRPSLQEESACPGQTGRSSAVTLGPALCLGTQLQTTQAMPGTGLSPPHQPFPHPHPHTGSHLLWQTASFKLLTPVVLIQGVTGDPSLANRRE